MERELMKAEAIKRMKKLELLPIVVDGFDKLDDVYISEYQGSIFPAVLYSIDMNICMDEYKAVKEKIDMFEESNECLVYHVIKDRQGWLNFLYVSKYDEEWEYDMDDLETGTPIAYVIGWENEAGTIGIRKVHGGVERIY